MEFKCASCNHHFKAKEKKVEYHDYVFGPCMKFVADCPECGKVSDEFRRPKPSKDMQACNDYQPSGCGNSGCCMN